MQGYINKISTKQGNGHNGPYTMYKVQIEGEWYGHGFKAPNANEGDYVEYNVVQKGQYKNVEGIKPIQGGGNSGGGSPSAAAPASAPINKKDVSIHYQSSRKDAIQTLGVLLANEAVKLPAKQADKYDAALALIDELTARYYLKLEDVIADGGVTEEDLVPPTGGE